MNTDLILVIARCLMSAIFILAGLMKFVAAAATQRMLAEMGLPAPVLAWLIIVLVELGGGLALMFGLATRQAAIVLGLWCILTPLVVHSNFADPAMRPHFMKNLVMAGGFANVAILGAGAFSIDGWRRRRKS